MTSRPSRRCPADALRAAKRRTRTPIQAGHADWHVGFRTRGSCEGMQLTILQWECIPRHDERRVYAGVPQLFGATRQSPTIPVESWQAVGNVEGAGLTNHR